MSDAPPDGPDSRRALLAVLCVFGLVAASAAAPALAGETPLGGLDSPQAPSNVPSFLRHFDGIREALGGDTPNTGGSGENLFGALSPGSSTDVGGPVSQQAQRESSSVHFIGTSTEPTYWRTAAYERYTGSGWEQAEVVPLRDPGTTATIDEGEWSRVVLRKPARTLPTPWKPVDFRYRCGENITCDTTFELLESGGLRADEPLEAGATYRVRSVAPNADPSVLRQTRVRGSKVDDKYTSVETTDRVRELAADVVGDANNRYEAAKNVERYLESEKSYSLSDVPKPGDQVADQFLFEQEKGYCEYYATTMVVMLRSQGIPARYVVGYAEGEHVGQNRYLLRGADAHAWVEVYFEHVGWVRFDPTPAAPRRSADDRLASGSPTYQISLNETPTPGEDVTATVKAGGIPAPDVAVTVNGDRVGVTDVSGNVTFTVPYAERLTINAQPAENTITVEVGELVNASGFVEDGRAYAVPPPSLPPPDAATASRSATRTQPENESNGTTTEFGVRADVTFEFDSQVEPGETMALVVRLNGEPFRNASVSIAGAGQGRTDANGRIRVDIPADASGVVELTATRENLSQTTTYPIDDLTVSVSPSLTAPLPWTQATARVTSGGEAVQDAVVTVNGDRVGYTNGDGEVTFEIPLGRTPSVTAEASGKQAGTHVGWVLPTFALAVALALSALGGVALFARRRGVTLDRIVTVARTVAREAASRAVQALVATADAIDELAAEFREAAEDGWRGVLAWLATLPGRVSAPPVRAWVVGAVAAMRAALGAQDEAGIGPDGDAPAGEDDFGRLQTVWQRFVRVVGVDRWETKTPGQVARAAISKGFPRKPVYALTNAFRAAAYGGREEGSRLDTARRALAALRSEEEGDK